MIGMLSLKHLCLLWGHFLLASTKSAFKQVPEMKKCNLIVLSININRNKIKA